MGYPQIQAGFEQLARESERLVGDFEKMATGIAPQFLTRALRSID